MRQCSLPDQPGDVVDGNRYHEEHYGGEAREHERVGNARRDRPPDDRFDDDYEQAPAVEPGYGQKVDEREVYGNERRDHRRRAEALLDRALPDARDADGARHLAEVGMPREQLAEERPEPLRGRDGEVLERDGALRERQVRRELERADVAELDADDLAAGHDVGGGLGEDRLILPFALYRYDEALVLVLRDERLHRVGLARQKHEIGRTHV